MLFQERQELFLERLLSMVFRLGIDVGCRAFAQRNVEAESAIAFLPGKVAVLGKFSCTQNDDPPLMSWMALAIASVDGNDKSKWT